MKTVTVTCTCNHCSQPIDDNDLIQLDEETDVHKNCMSAFWNKTKKVVEPDKTDEPKKKRRKATNKHKGIFYEKRINKWRGAARFWINGTDSDHFENLSYATEEEALKDRQAKLLTGKKLLDKVFKKFGIEKRVVLKGHYIDIIDTHKVPVSENVVEGTFGKIDERM